MYDYLILYYIILYHIIGGPVPDAAAASTAVPEGGQDDLIPVVFTWTQGGQSVYLAVLQHIFIHTYILI